MKDWSDADKRVERIKYKRVRRIKDKRVEGLEGWKIYGQTNGCIEEMMG